MRTVTAVVMAAALASNCSALAADVATIDDMHHTPSIAQGSMTQNPESHMFDGIKLSEQQRQQMRDLMRQARAERHDVPPEELEKLHRLVTAEHFDEAAVKAQMERVTEAQLDWQVEMAKVRNQMYHLLTPAQQAVLHTRHEQRMQALRKLADRQQASSLQAVSSTGSTRNGSTQ
ncbi:cell-envelope stress modulator CpxP [Pantoea sp. 1.19]|uniref:cell-envelope stress modulator CpxP n=1 Tax=Pantoea sp. 1.19 TaxID=1925589 RepID=UPI000948920D|nr:cell-envelope stress modulator CpxP [Pantoea sp. 1.19]